jgi:hypothetical protein
LKRCQPCRSRSPEKNRLINSSRARTTSHSLRRGNFYSQSSRSPRRLLDRQERESNHHSLRRGTVKVVRRSPATRLFRTPIFFLVFDLFVFFFCAFLSRVRLCERNTKNVYDPSAGSPTETLLRLLLPLKDQVRPSFSLAVGRRRTGRDCSPLDGTPTSPSEGLTKSFNR